MVRVKFGLSTVGLLVLSVIATALVHAQATVETGGLMGGPSNLPPMTPNFAGMGATLTNTAPVSADAPPPALAPAAKPRSASATPAQEMQPAPAASAEEVQPAADAAAEEMQTAADKPAPDEPAPDEAPE